MGDDSSNSIGMEIFRHVLQLLCGVLLLYLGYKYFNPNTPAPPPVVVTPTPAPTAKSQTAINAPLAAPALDFAINYLFRPNGTGAFVPLADGGAMRSGDLYKVIFTPSRDSYVYIFQVDATGQLYCLFPMETYAGMRINNLNPVQNGKTYFIPAENYSFQLDRNIGAESIYFLALRQPDIALEQAYQEFLAAQKREQPDQIKQTQSRLLTTLKGKGMSNIVADPRGTITWQEQGERFSAARQRLQMCDGCVNVLKFTHQ